MDAAEGFVASVTVMEVGVTALGLGSIGEMRGDVERRRGGRGGGGALKSMSNIALGGGGGGPALE
jgi:hypothetical protein